MIVVTDSERGLPRSCPKDILGNTGLFIPISPRNVAVVIIEHPADTPQDYKWRLDVPRPGCAERGLAVWPFCKTTFNFSLLSQVLAPELYFQQSQGLLKQSLNDCVSQTPNQMLQISQEFFVFQLVTIFVAIFAINRRLSALQLQTVQHQLCWSKDLAKCGGGTGSRCLFGIILEKLFIMRGNFSDWFATGLSVGVKITEQSRPVSHDATEIGDMLCLLRKFLLLSLCFPTHVSSSGNTFAARLTVQATRDSFSSASLKLSGKRYRLISSKAWASRLPSCFFDLIRDFKRAVTLSTRRVSLIAA